jgi:hypothetical protein
MQRWTYRSLILIIAIAATVAGGRADEPKKKAKANKLIGTWKVLSIKNGGVDSPLPQGAVMLKHVTPTHFIWVQYDSTGRVTRTVGGPYKVKGDSYIEIPQYGFSSDFAKLQGNPQKFTWRIEENKWYHQGTLSYGLPIEEVWVRVDKDAPAEGVVAAEPASER